MGGGWRKAGLFPAQIVLMQSTSEGQINSIECFAR
jgi:hypothetical protein